MSFPAAIPRVVWSICSSVASMEEFQKDDTNLPLCANSLCYNSA